MASRGAAARGVTVKPTGCGFDPHSRRWNICLNLYFHFFALVSKLSAALSSATQHAMPPEFSRKWGTECLNTRFPLATLLCAGYSVKLIYFYFIESLIWIYFSYLKYRFNCNIVIENLCDSYGYLLDHDADIKRDYYVSLTPIMSLKPNLNTSLDIFS